MSYVLAFLGIKDGQGVTTTALALADAIAAKHSTLFIDADMSGTGTAVDALHLNPERRGFNSLLGETPLTSEMLQREAIASRNPNLELIPGLIAVCGSDVVVLAERLQRGNALAGLCHDFVVLDLGSAWAHPWLSSARAAAQAVARISNRVFVVFQDSPTRMVRAVQVLKSAQPPKAELILMETRGGSLNRQAREALRYNLPDLSLATRVRWDPKQSMNAEDRGVPMPGIGPQLIRELQILERASVVLSPTPAPERPAIAGA
ncbi:MAG TPA: hypothetical protein VG015_06530 [Candidatus Dormibacteraeota bacterium]|jgi:MinD-like ATPase involved in chromosome partitioning or flagellar assembly|nr:hypothetical protein [Candidatus Dormibacteraeota bacterium]